MLMQFSTFRKCKSNTHAILIFEESLSPMFMQLSTFWKSKFNTHAILIFIESKSNAHAILYFLKKPKFNAHAIIYSFPATRTILIQLSTGHSLGF